MMDSNSTVPSEIPWLMLPRTKDDQEKGWIRFYSISHKKDFSITIPNPNDNEVQWTNCLNSSGEWLMVLDDISDLHMLNPITGTHIPLPPFATFDCVKPLYEEEPTGGRILDYALPFQFPHPIMTAQEAGMIYLIKAVVGWTTTTSSSPPTYTVMAISECYMRKLTFARKGDTKWTPFRRNYKLSALGAGASCFEDIMYHNGRFLALSSCGAVISYNFSRHEPKVAILAKALKGTLHCSRYLVRLFGKLFQVLRFPDDSVRILYKTLRFEVHKRVGEEWVEVKDLGGHSLFVGRNNTISVSSHHSPAVKGNCIYFSDDYFRSSYDPPPAVPHLGIFSLQDGSFSTYFPDGSSITWPLPLWFVPNPVDQCDWNLGETERKGKKHKEFWEESGREKRKIQITENETQGEEKGQEEEKKGSKDKSEEEKRKCEEERRK